MSQLILELPWPPSVNHYWDTDWKKRSRHLSKRAHTFRENVLAVVYSQSPRPETMLGPLEFAMDLYPPKNFEYDCDNFTKGVWDALQNARVFVKDSQFRDAYVAKREVHPQGKAVVCIKAVS